MAIEQAAKKYVNNRIVAAITALRKDLLAVLLDHLPRHAEFNLTNVAVGTQTQDVSWLVPITGDYTVVAAATTGTAFVGFIAATVSAGTKTPTGCTLIVANRGAGTAAAVAFDVLAFPIGG